MSSWASLVKGKVEKKENEIVTSKNPAKMRDVATKAMQESPSCSNKKPSAWSTTKNSSEKPNFFKIMLETKTTAVEMRKNLVTFPQLGDLFLNGTWMLKSLPETTKVTPLRGLENSHNHCFRNAVIQSLSSVGPFFRLFHSISQLDFPPDHTSFLKMYADFHRQMWQQKQTGKSIVFESKSPSAASMPSDITAEAVHGRSCCKLNSKGDSKRITSPEKEKAVSKVSKACRRRMRKKKMMMTHTMAASVSKASGDEGGRKQQQQPRNEQVGNGKENFVLRKDACTPTTLSPILEAFQRKQLGQQEDAQEFFHFLVEELHNEMLRLLENSDIADKRRRSHIASVIPDEDDGWNEVGKNGKSALVRNEIRMSESPISRIFGGSMRLELRRRGLKNTVSMQPFYELHLDIEDESIQSVEHALKMFLSPDQIQGLRSSSGNEVHASQHVSIAPPLALVLHLKRFNFKQIQGYGGKLDKFISYSEKLKLQTKALYGTYSAKEFELKSLIVHVGSRLNGGHYTAYVKHGNHCFLMDDSRVIQVSKEEMMRQQAYLLFYEATTCI
mmetsp:Transcript_3649/g.4965  ORF Transcript_3649/g.4965 Transcript_3649/m.4965 type:complete len:557 (-) Transcript_3649:356-2026(-)|eukprot:CAMPEP_0185262510 /NCGR_PEP_ID=MMETSP1359-20130426/10634_1 /TAXON_ID=552665 /ORGANISM="Bigelowiella longifila, Strain CCMP242" /LENGTH=556 /DNA_ID=CAMNT_0027849471 /DNA_START=53 /DNA_END=1723 /DNA_ORIENTATION=+